MSLSSPSLVLPAPDAAVLLVLLPLVPVGEAATSFTTDSLRALQGRLGSSIRVLKVDEATHPAVVRSFGTPTLPACVLVRQGVELWRQHGLPEDEAIVTTLLDKVDVS